MKVVTEQNNFIYFTLALLLLLLCSAVVDSVPEKLIGVMISPAVARVGRSVCMPCSNCSFPPKNFTRPFAVPSNP